MHKVVRLLDLDCAHCAAKMQEEIGKLDGVNKVRVNFMGERMTLDCEDDKYDAIMKEAEKIIHGLEPDVTIKA